MEAGQPSETLVSNYFSATKASNLLYILYPFKNVGSKSEDMFQLLYGVKSVYFGEIKVKLPLCFN
jgi:hypothetical protein